MEEEGLGLAGDKGQQEAEQEEDSDLGGGDEFEGPDWDGMQQDVEVRAERVGGRVLPGLQAVAEQDEVQRLPVVEDLVAVPDEVEEGGEGAGGEDEHEDVGGDKVEPGVWLGLEALGSWCRVL